MNEVLYGVMAEFETAQALVVAAGKLRQQMPPAILEAYAPFPVAGLDELLEPGTDRTPAWMLLGALLGGLGTFAVECYSAVIDYPIRVGGRPTTSWQAFLPPAIEMTILGAALLGVLALLIGTGLPKLRHPLFAVPAFERASTDRFFLLLRADKAGFDRRRARAVLAGLDPVGVWEVPA